MLHTMLLLQLAAHLLADFIFQPQEWSDKKSRQVIGIHHLYHVLVVGLCAYALSLDPYFWIAALTITFFHLATDVFKSWLTLHNPGKNYFFLDQGIHLLFMVAITWAYDHIYGIHFWFEPEMKTVAMITGFILCTKPANMLIKNIFNIFSIEVPEDENDHTGEQSLPNAGKLIGIVERTMTLLLIILGQYQVVGLILAAKSILRFSSTQKNEYVLVGTLLSFSIAIIAGALINVI